MHILLKLRLRRKPIDCRGAPFRQRAATASIFLALVAFVVTLSAQPTNPVIGYSYTEVPAVDSGEALLGELNCVACHKADGFVTARLASRQSPRLGESGLRLTAQFLRALLADPQKEKSGTTMPDVLHGLSRAEKAEMV